MVTSRRQVTSTLPTVYKLGTKQGSSNFQASLVRSFKVVVLNSTVQKYEILYTESRIPNRRCHSFARTEPNLDRTMKTTPTSNFGLLSSRMIERYRLYAVVDELRSFYIEAHFRSLRLLMARQQTRDGWHLAN